MKNFLLLFVFIITIISCKDKDETPQPISKDGILEIEYTATIGGGGSSELTLVNKTNYEPNQVFKTDTSTSISYTINKTIKGGQNFRLLIRTKNINDATSFTGNYNIKATFDGKEITNISYVNLTSYGMDIIVPFKD
jgi:hypothetical protein